MKSELCAQSNLELEGQHRFGQFTQEQSTGGGGGIVGNLPGN